MTRQRDETRSMRSKVEANDYRYFPDPDLLPISISQDLIKKYKRAICLSFQVQKK